MEDVQVVEEADTFEWEPKDDFWETDGDETVIIEEIKGYFFTSNSFFSLFNVVFFMFEIQGLCLKLGLS